MNARSHLFPLVFLFDMLLLSLILCFFLSNLSLFFLLKSDLIKISFSLPLKSPSILSRLAEPFPVRRSSKGLRSCNIFTVPAYYLTLSITKQRPKGRSVQWHCPFPNEGGILYGHPLSLPLQLLITFWYSKVVTTCIVFAQFALCGRCFHQHSFRNNHRPWNEPPVRGLIPCIGFNFT